MPGKHNAIIGVIPARYKSSRFPGKPLVEIAGVPMIKRTYQQALKSDLLDDLVVATDDNQISDYCVSEGIPVVMTSSCCLTGTDRLAEVACMDEYSKYDLYINIQGDEPVIDPVAISEVAAQYKKFGDQYIAYNLYKVIRDEVSINSDAIVKVIVNENDELMFMSRLPVPYSKSGLLPEYKQQIPVYGYTSEALKLFSSYDKTLNEKFEDVELLRFVDLAYKVKMAETVVSSISVDIPEDVSKIESFLISVNV